MYAEETDAASYEDITTDSVKASETDGGSDETDYDSDDYDSDDKLYKVIYRMYNPNSGEHLYTASKLERAHLYNLGWDAEDIGWVSPMISDTPIYRLYNGIEHLYTTDKNEANTLSEYHGWINEGEKFYADTKHSSPMYRLYNPNGEAGSHHYTKDSIEASGLIGLGWKSEGVAWYTLNMDTGSIKLPPLTEEYDHTIENTDSYASIEADVLLNGEGSGTHAKLLYQTPTSAVSFGIQYDLWGKVPYTDKTFYICENVKSNDKGGQRYTYYGTTTKDEWHHIMLTYDIGGKVTFYVDGDKVSEVKNTGLEDDKLYVSVEGSGRLDGDSIIAAFRNIKIKAGGVYDESVAWPTYQIITNPGLNIVQDGFDESSPSTGSALIYGTIEGIGDNDWDSAYGTVSAVFRLGNAIRE